MSVSQSQGVTATASADLSTKGDITVHDGKKRKKLAAGSDEQLLTADSTADTGLSWKPQFVDISTFFSGAPGNSEKIFTFAAPKVFTLPIGLTGTKIFAQVTATAEATVDIQKNDVSIGTITFAIASNTPTFTFASATAFAVGDRLQLINQATADATLADIAFTIRGDL